MGIKERKTKHKEDLRRMILDAARDLFVTEGYRNASIRKIAEKIEYSPTAIYFYFRDKAEILDALCAETFSGLDETLKGLNRQNVNSLDMLKTCARTYIDFGLSRPHHYLLVFVMDDQSVFQGERAEHKRKYGMQCFNNLRQSVKQAMDDGHLVEADLETTCQAVWAAMHGVTALLITQPGFPFVEREHLINRVIDMILDGIRRRDGA